MKKKSKILVMEWSSSDENVPQIRSELKRNVSQKQARKPSKWKEGETDFFSLKMSPQFNYQTWENREKQVNIKKDKTNQYKILLLCSIFFFKSILNQLFKRIGNKNDNNDNNKSYWWKIFIISLKLTNQPNKQTSINKTKQDKNLYHCK